MGCCGPVEYPKNDEIENAIKKNDLIEAMRNVIIINQSEIFEIENYLKNNVPLETDGLSIYDDDCLQKRMCYLEELNTSYEKLIKKLEDIEEDFPMRRAKDLLQRCSSHYFVAYDETRRYLNDEANFMDFAKHYTK